MEEIDVSLALFPVDAPAKSSGRPAFESEVIEKMVGHQRGKWDWMIDELNIPGKVLFFNPEDVTTSQAAQAAARMRVLDPGHHYHSGFHSIKRKNFVRRRMDDEMFDAKEDKQEESNSEEQNNDASTN